MKTRWSAIAAITLAVAGCVHVAPLRVYPDEVPADSLRLVQAMLVGTRADIIGVKEWHQALLDAGIPDEDIRDGSMAVGRIWCCGGPAEGSDRQAFYVPPGLKVAPLDVVELRAGREPGGTDRGRPNVATRVVQSGAPNDGTCRWEPRQPPGLYMRVLYCDWMSQEGWIEYKTTLKHTWFKPPPGYAPPK
jgi:hypothetical protein